MGKCIEKIKSIIKKVDLFGTFINFHVQREREYKSLIGGSCTVVYIIIAFAYIIYMAIPFIKRKDIIFTYSHKILTSNPFINFTKINFMFAFGLLYKEDESGAIDDTIDFFEYELILREWIGTDDIYDKIIKLKKCEVSDFPSLLQDQFELNELEELLCPNIPNNYNFSLDGLYTDDYFKYIILKIKLTQYAKDNLDMLNEFLKENPLYMSVFFKDTGINYENKKVPLPPYINYIYKDFELEFIKKSIMFYSPIEFRDDQNFFFQNNHIYQDSMFDKNDDSFKKNYLEVQDGNLEIFKDEIFEMEFRVSPRVITLKRKYQKIPEFIASLSGLLSFLLAVNIVISNLIQRKVIDQLLIHKLIRYKGNTYFNIPYLISKFNFNSNDNFSDKKILIKNIGDVKSSNNIENDIYDNNIIKYNDYYYKDSQKKKKELNIQDSRINSNRKLISEKKFNQKNIIELSINKMKKKEKDPLKLTTCEIILSIFCVCCYKQKSISKLITKAENKIYYYMDIETYISVIQEFELLKELLFQQEYLNILRFISKPLLKIEKEKFVFARHIKDKMFQKYQENEIDDLISKYKELCTETKLSDEKVKMIKFLKKEINFLCENNN